MEAPRLVSLTVGADPAAWRAAGFRVGGDGLVQVGGTTLHLAGTAAGDGILGWSLRGVVTAGGEPIDGLPDLPLGDAVAPLADGHPNGAQRLDHVVLLTPALSRTLAALADAGLELRRTRDVPRKPLRQAFYRLGEVVLEVVGEPDGAGDGPCTFWGLVVVVPDLEALPDGLCDDAHDAVQPGRRIATARGAAALGTHVAFMTP
jgi:hypothetical protein